MTIPVWPDELPGYFLTDNFAFSFPDGRVKSQPDSGPPKMRRRTSAVVTPIAGAFVTRDNNDWLRLLDFYKVDLAYGTLPFMTRDRMLDGVPLAIDNGAPLLTDAGDQLLIEAWWLALFDSVPTMSNIVDDQYRVSFSFNVLP